MAAKVKQTVEDEVILGNGCVLEETSLIFEITIIGTTTGRYSEKNPLRLSGGDDGAVHPGPPSSKEHGEWSKNVRQKP